MRFAYSALPDSGDNVTLQTLYSAADEIHRFCRIDGPIMVAPRTQRVWVGHNCKSWVHYPIDGDFTVMDGDTDISDDSTMITDRLLLVPEKNSQRYLTIEADAGWGKQEELGHFGGEVPWSFEHDRDILSATNAGDHVSVGYVLRIQDELMIVDEIEGEDVHVLRGVAGTTPVDHQGAGVFVHRVRAPALLEDAADGIAKSLAVRRGEPGRGVARSVQVQSGFRLVRTDPLAAYRPDLLEYVR